MTQRELKVLTPSECIDLLKTEVIGRLVFVDESGPGAVPVNYGIAGDQIVVRVAEDSSLRKLIGSPIAFEVDQTDRERQEGWSVLVRGPGREVDLADVPDLLDLMGDTLPSPWAEGVHNHWIAIEISLATGRRLSGAIDAALY